VTVDVVKNKGASVRQRLLNHAKASGRPFFDVLACRELYIGKLPSPGQRWTLIFLVARTTPWMPSSLNRARLSEAPRSLSEVVEELYKFFATILSQF
jgi:hypothetical protein